MGNQQSHATVEQIADIDSREAARAWIEQHNLDFTDSEREQIEQLGAEIRVMQDLRDRLDGTDSIAEDAPELSGHFHEIRTSSRSRRDGKYFVALDIEEGELRERFVTWLNSGEHYRDPPGDLSFSLPPKSFMSVKTYARSIRDQIRGSAHHIEDIESHARMRSWRDRR